jgi:hypothetical protein
MKLVLLALLFVVYVESRPDAEHHIDVSHLDEMLSAGIDRALKRKEGDGYTATPSDDCVKACAHDPPAEVGALLAKWKEPSLGHLKDLYNKERLTKICTHANTTGACVRACPDGKRKEYVKKLFKPIKYMCAESHFVDYSPCYHDVWEEMKEVCKGADKCGPKKAAFKEALDAYKAASPKTKAGAESMVSKLCAGIDCALDCADAKRIEKCGADKNTVLRHFYHELEDSLKEARYMSPRDFVIDWPTECDHIGHDS